ncbi:MAG TPA: DUF3137 domain-containing protein [Vicinamibacterales bacterium]
MSPAGQRSTNDAEQPPFVQGLIIGAIEQGGAWLHGTLRSVDQRVLIWCWGRGAAGLFVLVLIGSVIQSPTIVGVLQGLFAGGFLALLFAVAFGFLLQWAREDRAAHEPGETLRAGELDARLAPALRELTALRTDIIAQVKARSILRVPLGTIGGIVAWVLARQGNDPPSVPALALFMIVGAIAGEYWAAYRLERQYRRRYKDSVLPQIATEFGKLSYRESSKSDAERLAGMRILPDYDSLNSDDEIHGVHNGLPIRIVEVRLRRRQNKKSVTVFDGLLVGITLPRSLTGTTLVATDRGAWENFKARWGGAHLEAVRLEHQEFEQRYEVSSTDQIEARALLTPAFMERFVELATRGGFALPGAIAEGNMLTVALSKRMGSGDLFEPPPYWMPAGGVALVRLENDIRAVLRIADTVIKLDFFAAGRQRDAERAATST